MLKVIAFDLIGVLLTEKVLNMTEEEQISPKKRESEHMVDATKIISGTNERAKMTINLLNRLYHVKAPELLPKLKMNYPNIKLVIASNHLANIKALIGELFGTENLDRIFISAEMGKIKPNRDYYEEIVRIMACQPHEILFLDDSSLNVAGAIKVGFNVIKVEKEMDLFAEITNWLNEHKHI